MDPSPLIIPLMGDIEPLLTPADLVDRKVAESERTLEKWRHAGTGPPFLRLGRRVRYRATDVAAWLEQQVRGDAA
jgi:hypothetical protein